MNQQVLQDKEISSKELYYCRCPIQSLTLSSGQLSNATQQTDDSKYLNHEYKFHSKNNLSERTSTLLCDLNMNQQILQDKESFFKKSSCCGCPTQSLLSNKQCKWGGCHGPLMAKYKFDYKKGHMYKNGGQIWHCGGCCKMERENFAYESTQLLRQSDLVFDRNKKLQCDVLYYIKTL